MKDLSIPFNINTQPLHLNLNTLQGYFSTYGLEKALSYLIAGLFFLMIILLTLDTYEFLNDPEDYISVHHLDTTQKQWQLQYLKTALIGFPLCVAGLMAIWASYKYRAARGWVPARRLIVLSTLCLMTYWFYQSYLTGFDH